MNISQWHPLFCTVPFHKDLKKKLSHVWAPVSVLFFILQTLGFVLLPTRKEKHQIRTTNFFDCSYALNFCLTLPSVTLPFLFICLFSWDRTCCMTQVGFELLILLPQHPEAWDYRCWPPHLGKLTFFTHFLAYFIIFT